MRKMFNELFGYEYRSILFDAQKSFLLADKQISHSRMSDKDRQKNPPADEAGDFLSLFCRDTRRFGVLFFVTRQFYRGVCFLSRNVQRAQAIEMATSSVMTATMP